MNFTRAVCLLAAIFALSGCDQKHPRPQDTLKLATSDGQTFLIDEQVRRVYLLRNGEFVELPTVAANDLVGKQASKSFLKDVPKFFTLTFLKYRNGQIFYQVTVFPASDKGKPKLSNWMEYLKSPSNFLKVNLQDKDGFNIQTIDIAFGGISQSPRTTIVNDSGKETSVEFDGVLQANASVFQLISDANVTYSLDPPVGYTPPSAALPTSP